jgi:N-acyl homoserine lactone hydrolase
MATIHAIRTGLVKVRHAQMESKGRGPARIANMLFDENWSEWLPVYSWVIDHEEGIIVVDTGETSRVHEKGYHPRWHPFFRRAARFSVHPDEEIGPQLRRMGIDPRDVRHTVLTHLHTDHAGGLAHLTGSKVWVAKEELARATGPTGAIQGYLRHRWPKWLEWETIRFEDRPLGPFEQSMPLTRRRDVHVVRTPGHTPGHVSVVVSGSPSFFLAGDTSYNQALLLAGKVDGVSPDVTISRKTMGRIMALAKDRPLVYLPSHDPAAADRLTQQSTL